MHSFWHRANTLLTFFGTVAAVLCLLTTGTDLFYKSNPKISVSIAEIKRLVPYKNSKDQVVLTFDLEANLTSVFSWNTKQIFLFLQAEYQTPENGVNQVVLWDSIIRGKEKANIRLKKHKTKYAFIDNGKYLRDREVNLTLVWCVMPKVGYLHTHTYSVNAGRLPGNYMS